ncbi:hypothetical protein [Pedobacter insulae]|uniref:Uncharacterized protein n=1 Tax=Pedobacter insulae TaxID=414048 RepID=A0A1I2UXV4_9SPHI|nr:hypothetical protein [Pedobacter insulae]SFG81995.1 hypothetical protein SAMN04489864_102406 [Pedobacter insulae]
MENQNEQNSDFNQPQSKNEWSQKDEPANNSEMPLGSDSNPSNGPLSQGSDADHANAAVGTQNSSPENKDNPSANADEPNYNSDRENLDKDPDKESDFDRDERSGGAML